MHELSIALGIVKIAEKETKKANKVRVDSIVLEIGTLSGIEINALNYAWDIAVKDTVLEHSKKEITNIDAKAICLDCNNKFKPTNIYDLCPHCESFKKEIIKGKELIVKSIEVS